MSSAALSLVPLLSALPSLLVYLGGILAAAIAWQRSPRACLLVVVALGLMALLAVTAPFLYQAVAMRREMASESPATTSLIYGAIGLAQSLLHGVGVALLVAAALVGRRR